MPTIKPELFQLRYATPQLWVDTVLNDFAGFLNDHAQAEKKASGMAMSMLSHYPDRPELVKAMIDLAIEELAHFREVIKRLQAQDLCLGSDEKDPYVNAFRQHMRNGTDLYLLDRLLIAAIIEARGCERFGLIGQHHTDSELRSFYQLIAESEAKHHMLFVDLATLYFDITVVEERLDTLLTIEANIVKDLPIRPALH
jgi:tRNA-(ms[2]io[6]A)-hydroxylase